jgi:hypothetical protein
VTLAGLVLEIRDSANLARRIVAALLDAMTPDAIPLLDTILAATGDLDAIGLWRPSGERLH